MQLFQGCQHGVGSAFHHHQRWHLRSLRPRLWDKSQKDWLRWGRVFELTCNLFCFHKMLPKSLHFMMNLISILIPGFLRPILHIFTRILLVWSHKPHMEIFHRHRFPFCLFKDQLFPYIHISHYISIYGDISLYTHISLYMYLLSDGDVYDISATISLNPKTNTLFDLRWWSKNYISHYMLWWPPKIVKIWNVHGARF